MNVQIMPAIRCCGNAVERARALAGVFPEATVVEEPATNTWLELFDGSGRATSSATGPGLPSRRG